MNKAEETRQYIIEQAAPIFNRYGYKGTSMSQLTKAINMTKGAIYGNFKNKDEIALAVFEYNFNKFLDKAAETVLAKRHACDKLTALAGFFLDKFSLISGHGGCPVLNAAVDSDNAHAMLKDKVVQVLEGWMENVVRIIRYGIRHGHIHKHAKPEQFASVFVSLIEGGLLLSKVTGNSIHLSRNIDHIIHLVNTELRI